MRLPNSVHLLLEKLNNAGYEAYVVGGCVRDSLIGKTPKDWDICTNAKPEKVIEVFKGFQIIPTGLKHGTVTVMVKGVGYEITTYRIDGEYSDGRHPDKVSFTSNLAEDLARRDFTINAMAYSDMEGIVDLYGGVEDLKKGIIRCVGKPEERFNEDALRIMRAMRFASVLNFYIEEKTSNAMFKLYENLDMIAKERINVELSKLLLGKGRYRILKKYTDIISFIIPEIKPMIGFEQKNPWHNSDVWEHTLRVVKAVDNNDLNTLLAALLHDIGKPSCFTVDLDTDLGHFYGHPTKSREISEGILKGLKFSNEVIDETLVLIENHDVDLSISKRTIRRMLNKMGKPTLEKLLELKRADNAGQSNYRRNEMLNLINDFNSALNDFEVESECFSLKQLKINGGDLIALGYKPGKGMGEILNRVLNKVIEEELPNDKDEILKYVKGAFPVFGNKMIEIAQETIQVSKDGCYANGSVKFDTTNNTELFTDSDFEKVYKTVLTERKRNSNVNFEIRNEGTVDAVFRLAKSHKDLSLGVLNFASAHNPGGGFENGAMAQEECIAYCSDLYLKQVTGDGADYYTINASNHTPLYTDTSFMSNVTFFRNSKYAFVKNPIMCNVLTMPAVNMGVALRQGYNYNDANTVMKNRMRKVLLLFAYCKCTTIVLGAFGCGVFGNKGEDVARFWKELLIDEGLGAYFENVVFSIYDRPGRVGNCEIFQEVLGK